MAYFFSNIKNSFDFFLRNRIIFSRKNYYEKAQNVSDIFVDDEEENFYNRLKDKYGDGLEKDLNKRNFLENIYFLNIFDKYISLNKSDNITVLDIGSKNWSYVKSEYMYFKSKYENFVLNGIELDAYRLNSNFYTRYEIAKFYTKGLNNTNYIAGDFMAHEQKYDCIIWILPFVTQYPLIKWGLPLKYFQPENMLLHAFNLLKEGGEMLIINQGEKEYEIQQKLIKNLPQIDAQEYILFGEIQDKFKLFQNLRFCSKIIKH